MNPCKRCLFRAYLLFSRSGMVICLCINIFWSVLELMVWSIIFSKIRPLEPPGTALGVVVMLVGCIGLVIYVLTLLKLFRVGEHGVLGDRSRWRCLFLLNLVIFVADCGLHLSVPLIFLAAANSSSVDINDRIIISRTRFTVEAVAMCAVYGVHALYAAMAVVTLLGHAVKSCLRPAHTKVKEPVPRYAHDVPGMVNAYDPAWQEVYIEPSLEPE